MFVLDHDGGEVRQQRIIDPAVYVGYLIENAVGWKIEFAMPIERNEKKEHSNFYRALISKLFWSILP